MYPLRSLLVYIVAIFVLGALLAPALYEAVQWAASVFPVFAALAQHPFHRFVRRSLQLTALIGLWPFLRSIRVHSWRDVGLVGPSGQGRRLALGFAAGFASLACIAILAIAVGARRLDPDPRVAKLAGVALTAAGVAILEELLFRGALFNALRKAHALLVALTTSSAVYALLHFFQKPPAPEQVTWSSGLESLLQMLRGFSEVGSLVPGFFTLTLAGAILALAFQRTGNLYFSIGLHAGWVFWVKSYSLLTRAQPGAGLAFWGSNKLIDGWLAAIVLTALLGLLPVLLPQRAAPAAGAA
jgi:uncharacterized protein